VIDLLSHFNRWFERDDPLVNVQHLQVLYRASLQDSASNQLALTWADRYRDKEDERYMLLEALTLAIPEGESDETRCVRLFRRLYAQSNSLALMLLLRADMLRWKTQIPGVVKLEKVLAGLLVNWFDVGMLELRPINWDSPASLLEKLIEYEAVHEIQSWADMKRRVAADRRCYAFFHPRLPDVPLIFVEVALAEHMATHVQALLDPSQPISPTQNKARWAIFYSISNTQMGLRGISFGGFLLKRVIDALVDEIPSIKSFATLSPIPGFTKWLGRQSKEALAEMIPQKEKSRHALAQELSGEELAVLIRTAVETGEDEGIKGYGMRVVAHYLRAMHDGEPVDPVARFHLGNGASIGNINWAADRSAKGMAQSCGLMVNYLYEPEKLDANRLRLAEGSPRVSRKVQRLL